MTLIPGDAQSPHLQPIKPSLWQSNAGGQEAIGVGLVPAPPWPPLHGSGSAGCLGVRQWGRVSHLNPVHPLSKPGLAAPTSSCWLTRANTFSFHKHFSCFIRWMALGRSCSGSIVHLLTVPLETWAGDNRILFILLIINY